MEWMQILAVVAGVMMFFVLWPAYKHWVRQQPQSREGHLAGRAAAVGRGGGIGRTSDHGRQIGGLRHFFVVCESLRAIDCDCRRRGNIPSPKELITSSLLLLAAMIRIMLVDDHDPFRAGVRSILGPGRMVVVGEYANGEDTVNAWCAPRRPDPILMDVNMPGIGGVEATRKIPKIAPNARVIAGHRGGRSVSGNQLLDAGARGYIPRAAVRGDAEAIRMVMRGQHYISGDVAQKLTLANFRKGGESSVLGTLSARRDAGTR